MSRIANILFVATLVCLPLYAAEDDPAPEPQAEDAAETNTGNAADSQAQQAQQTQESTTTEDGLTIPPSDEDFVPTVRITEDLPVAFPVDI